MKVFRVTLSWREGVEHTIETNSEDEALCLAQQKKFDDADTFYENHQALSYENWEVKPT